jgi:hypothetical protein
MEEDSILTIELDLGGSLNGDSLTVAGDVSIDGAELHLSLANAPSSLASPLTFLIARKSSDGEILGSFGSITGLPQGYDASLIYDFAGEDSLGRLGNGNDLTIVITAVPEPATVTGLSLLAALSLAGARRQRRHRNNVAV